MSEKMVYKRFVLTGVAALLAAVGLVMGVAAGTVSRTQFTLANDGVSDSNLVATAAGVGLSIDRYQTIKMFGDSFTVSPARSSYSDVVVNGVDTFTYYYMDTAASRVRYQGIRLHSNGIAVSGMPGRVFDCNPEQDCYLHVDLGQNGVLGSFIQEGDGIKRYLQVHNGSRAINIDSANTTGWLFSSQCVMRGDTFLVINSTNMSRVMLRKVYSRGSTISIIDSVEVAVGAATQGNSLMNCAVAVDENGLICASWVRGSPNSNKYIYYHFYEPDLTPGPTGSFPQRICNNDFNYYDDAPLVSYGPGRFAFAAWDASGVLLHRLQVSGNSVNVTTSRVIAKSGVSYTAIGANGRFLAVACVGDVDGNGIAAVEGLLYTLDNYDLGAPETISFSDPQDPVLIPDRFSSAMNCAIDDSGTVALTWKDGVRVGASIWGYRAVRHAKGFYTSPVESLTLITDSIQFKPLQSVLNKTTSWSTEDSLRFGATPQACVNAPWLSFSDATVLRNNRTTGCYYQYRVTINRAVGGIVDSLTTAELTRVNLSWNTQPRITGIDSLIVDGIPDATVASGDSVVLVSRKDSMRLYLHAYDNDPGASLTFSLSQAATPQSVNGAVDGLEFTGMQTVVPLPVSDTVYACSVKVVDNEGWYGVALPLYLKTENRIPGLSVSLHHKIPKGSGGSGPLRYDTSFVLQEEDTLELSLAVQDTNDANTVKGYFIREIDGETIALDSTDASVEGTLTIVADTVVPVDSIRLWCTVDDPDTGISYYCGIVINHKPAVRSLIAGGDTLDNGDTLNVVLDDSIPFTISVNDTDCSFDDTLMYTMVSPLFTDSRETRGTEIVLTLIPDWNDTLVRFRVSDRFGRTDSMMIHLAYPWYATDTIDNPGYGSALALCRDSLSLIDGSDVNDTVELPIVNSGRNSLMITGCRFALPENRWMSVMVNYDSPDSFTVTDEDSLFSRSVEVLPFSTVRCRIIVSAQELSGDSVVCDSIILATDDPRHAFDTIPVCLEYNDLPRILSIDPDFIAGQPWQPIAKRMDYRFPPHATISIAFTEPMDSSSAVNGISVFSRTDALYRGRIVPIPIVQQWFQNYTVLQLTPGYDEPSPSFNVLPPAGLFIPTDSLEVVISSSLTDVASTPSGPNELDVMLSYQRNQNTDTTMGMRVDSIEFTVLSIEPHPGDTGLERSEPIVLTFSSPVYAASVDTSRKHNRSLIVRTLYNGGDTLSFSSIEIDSFSVSFHLQRELFYRDSLSCMYRSRWIRDQLGFASDNNRDGLDATMFDTASDADDLFWGYRVKPLRVASVEPDSGTEVKEVAPRVVIHFDDTVPAGVIDTDTSIANRSLRIGSKRTGWSSLRNITFEPDSTSISFQPRLTFFSNDSVFCSFTGFTDSYRYERSTNYPDDSATVFGGYDWYFYSGEIGFYTYPNPYKPGVDERHCGASGPCGIWFKNLHTLATEISEVSISVFTMTAHPVFNSLKTGERIRFGENAEGDALPQWLWDTRNDHGKPVVSGLYLYAVYDRDKKLLKRGKIVIMR